MLVILVHVLSDSSSEQFVDSAANQAVWAGLGGDAVVEGSHSYNGSYE